MKLAPKHRVQGETKERGRPLQMGGWQVSLAKELTYKASLEQLQDEQNIPTYWNLEHLVPDVSTPHCTVKAVSLKTVLDVCVHRGLGVKSL